MSGTSSFSSSRATTVQDIEDIVEAIGRLWNDLPFDYAVTGPAALVYYGRQYGVPSVVSIVCPESSRDVLPRWAKTKGIRASLDQRNRFDIPMPGGGFRTIRVKFLQEGFERLDKVTMGPSGTRLLTLPGLADQMAQSYVEELEHASGHKQNLYAESLIWILNKSRASTDPRQLIFPDRVPHINRDAFWIPFTLSYPEAKRLLRRAAPSRCNAP